MKPGSLSAPHGDKETGFPLWKRLIRPPARWRDVGPLNLCFPRELEALPDKADEKSLLAVALAIRINGGESEKPRG